LQNRYNYVYDVVTKTYVFTTKNNILYRIAFVTDETLSAISGQEIPNVYQIIISKVVEIKERFDPLVSKTVENIVLKFFKNANNSLIYFCADDDGKERIRFKVFSRWYEKSEFKNKIIKKDNNVNIKFSDNSEKIIYTSNY
jgi:hypothetical protein